MRDETSQHLDRVENAIARAKTLLSSFGYPDDPRTTMVVGFISQMTEHHQAMLLLCRNDLIGSLPPKIRNASRRGTRQVVRSGSLQPRTETAISCLAPAWRAVEIRLRGATGYGQRCQHREDIQS
jgi:hypothetical protein